MSGDAGKGSKLRRGADLQKYRENWPFGDPKIGPLSKGGVGIEEKSKNTITDKSAKILIEDILDTLMEVGNGVTDDDLHEAANQLLRFRDEWFIYHVVPELELGRGGS